MPARFALRSVESLSFLEGSNMGAQWQMTHALGFPATDPGRNDIKGHLKHPRFVFWMTAYQTYFNK